MDGDEVFSAATLENDDGGRVSGRKSAMYTISPTNSNNETNAAPPNHSLPLKYAGRICSIFSDAHQAPRGGPRVNPMAKAIPIKAFKSTTIHAAPRTIP